MERLKSRKYKYLGKKNGNLKPGHTYYIHVRDVVQSSKKIAFVHDNATFTNCIGTVEFIEDDWTLL